MYKWYVCACSGEFGEAARVYLMEASNPRYIVAMQAFFLFFL